MAKAAAFPSATIPTRPVVVYIAGSGRSGSTLLERTLGAIPGYANVGELIDLFRRDVRGERCGCGLPLLSCPLWNKVGRRALGQFDSDALAEVARLQARVARQRHLPRLLVPSLRGQDFASALLRYAAAFAQIYQAVALETGARYIVDASKWPVQALALRLGGLDVRVVHLVRDARGVAHSLAKEVHRATALGKPEAMFCEPAAVSAVRWLATQSEVDLLQARGIPVARIRYGDFVTAPRPTVARALSRLDLSVPQGGLSHMEGRAVSLGPSHGLSGNPSRFRHGVTVMRSDDEWQLRMSRRDRVVVQAVALPQVLRFSAGDRFGRVGKTA